MSDWDFTVTGFRGSDIVIQTTHRGVSSMQMEVEAMKDLMAKRRFYTHIVVADLRPEWVRAQHGNAPWARDLSATIRPADLPPPRKRFAFRDERGLRKSINRPR